MPKRVIDLHEQRPLLDIVSYGRGKAPLTPMQRQQILLTVRRVPEVMVKVSGGARTLAGVERYVTYIGNKGDRGLEDDMRQQLAGEGFARHFVQDWDLDIEARRHPSHRGKHSRKPPKLVHNLIFSMPAGSSPSKVLGAVERLALNEWKLKHRYAMALHTDRPHPHVHVVVKAVSEEGKRLNIRKATLRSWRTQFAENLRELGQPANATERAVRGQLRRRRSDGRYRMTVRARSDASLSQESPPGLDEYLKSSNGTLGLDKGLSTLRSVFDGWHRLASNLHELGELPLANEVREFSQAIESPVVIAPESVGPPTKHGYPMSDHGRFSIR